VVDLVEGPGDLHGKAVADPLRVDANVDAPDGPLGVERPTDALGELLCPLETGELDGHPVAARRDHLRIRRRSPQPGTGPERHDAGAVPASSRMLRDVLPTGGEALVDLGQELVADDHVDDGGRGGDRHCHRDGREQGHAQAEAH
jgi:hypothetical protein